MSVASIDPCTPVSTSRIAMVYGSSPEAHPADQMRKLGRVVASSRR